MDRMNSRISIIISLMLLLGSLSPVFADESYMPVYTATPSAQTSQPTPTPTPAASSTLARGYCTITVKKGNNTLAPADVDFVSNSVANGKKVNQFTYNFGDGETVTAGTAVTHKYSQAGTYQVVAEPILENNLKLNPCKITVTIKAAPLVPHTSSCTSIRMSTAAWTAGNDYSVAITGRDNKGDVRGYRLQLDDAVLEQSIGDFTVKVASPGSYILKAFIKDTEDKWVGGEDKCVKQIQVKAAGITKQPETGPSSIYWLSLMGLFITWLGAVAWYRQQKL